MSLLVRLLQDVLLHRALAHQTVDVHVACLPDAVRAVLRLRVHRGVPVRVVEDHRVGAHEVDAEPAAARGEDEDEHLTVVVELLHHLLTLRQRRGAVHAQVGEVMHVEEGLEDVQHPRHLREQQAAVALAAEARQQLAYTSERRGGRTEHLELAAVVLEEALLRELHGVELTPLVDSASTCERERD